jgi:heme/copper-type cytochrome/quinol oxidase subunit 4
VILETQNPPRKGPSKLWLPVVLLIGLVLGVAFSSFVPRAPPFGYFEYRPFALEWDVMIHVVLSTISIALLVSLAAIYIRVYAETGARFALGIVVVLVALLIQSLIQYPLFLGLAAPFPLPEERYFSFADIFTIAAYATFLYLSLE